jgi:type IV pilus assembly protein PilC
MAAVATSAPAAREATAGKGLKRELSLPGLGRKRVKLRDIAVFSRQFATMVDAGLTIVRSLAILADQAENPAMKAVLSEVRADVEKGASLSQAMGRHPKAFNRLFVAMVKAGEAGGVLDQVLEQLASAIEKQVALRQKIVSALTYPAAVFGLVVCIVAGMLLVVVPKFKGLYDNLGGKLPLPTRILLGVSHQAPLVVVLLVAAGSGATFGLRRWRQTEAGRLAWDTVALKVPIFGRLVHKTALTRLARTLGVLLSSGVPILESREITSETVGNAVVAKAIRAVSDGVRRGEPLAKPLEDHPVVPSMVVQMLSVGEETGAVDTLLGKVGDFYDNEVEALVSGLTSLLEPLLVVVLGSVVGSMVLSLYMPMFNVIKLIQ